MLPFLHYSGCCGSQVEQIQQTCGEDGQERHQHRHSIGFGQNPSNARLNTATQRPLSRICESQDGRKSSLDGKVYWEYGLLKGRELRPGQSLVADHAANEGLVPSSDRLLDETSITHLIKLSAEESSIATKKSTRCDGSGMYQSFVPQDVVRRRAGKDRKIRHDENVCWQELSFEISGRFLVVTQI